VIEIPKHLIVDPSIFVGDPPVNSLKQELPFGELKWEDFERLCLRLAKQQSNIESCRLYGAQGDSQEGIDLYARFLTEEKYTIYQCKKVKNFGPEKIENAVNTFLEGEWIDKTERFFLCTEESMRSKLRQDEILKQADILKQQGISLEIWDREELSSKLKSHPQLVYDFFDLPWCEAFCGKDASEKIARRKTLPPKRKFTPIEGYLERFAIKDETASFTNSLLASGTSMYDLIKIESRIVLLGSANNGKSAELDQLAYRLALETSFFPYLVKLKNHSSENIQEYITEIDDVPHNQIVVLLDGLDEVQSGAFDTARRKIQKFNSDFPEIRIVVSCRRNFYFNDPKEETLNTLQGFRAYRLRNLSAKQIEGFLDSFEVFDKKHFEGEVGKKGFGELLTIPYYLKRLATQFKKEGAIANNVAEITLQLIQENIQKDVARYFHNQRAGKERSMLEQLMKVAFILEYLGRNYCTWSELQSILGAEEIELVKAASSSFEGTETTDGRWSFALNNMQEALAALTMKAEDTFNIRKIICFPPRHSKVKPTWANTISLLISILEPKSKRKELTEWLHKDHNDLIIRFEPDVVDEHFRLKVLNNIFDYYSNKGIRINDHKYSTAALAQFSKSRSACEFLLEKIRQGNPRATKINALRLISFYNIQNEFPALAADAKQEIEENLHGIERVPYQAIRAYASCFKLSESELRKLFDTFSSSNDTWERSALFWALYNQGKQEFFLKELLVIIKQFMNHEFSDQDDHRLADEPMYLRESIAGLVSRDSILALLEFIKDNFDQISYSIYFKEILDFGLKAAVNFANDRAIYEKVRDTFAIKDGRLNNGTTTLFLDYFKKTGQMLTIFSDVYKLDPQLVNHTTFHQLAVLADEASLKIFVDEFKEGRISKEQIISFQNYLAGYQRDLLVPFNTAVNDGGGNIPLPQVRDFEKEKMEQEELTKELLFDKDKFGAKVSEIFAACGKNEMSYNEMTDVVSHDDTQKYPPVLFDAIRMGGRKAIKKDVLLQRLNDQWSLFSIEEIYRFLKRDKAVTLEDSQKEIVKKWCDAELLKWKFTDATKKTEQGYSTSRASIYASFFIRHFDFKHLSENIYLDLLSIQRWDDDEIDIFPFVGNIIARDKIDTRVLENLQSGILLPGAYENHLTYSRDKHLFGAASLLLPFIINHETYQRHETLECFKLLKGDMIELEKSLDKITDVFRFDVINLLIENGSSTIKKFVEAEFEITEDEDFKIRYAFCLLRLQSLKGVRYFVSYLKIHLQIPEISNVPHSSFLAVARKLKFLPYIFQVYRMGYDKRIEQSDFLSLHSIASQALQSVCLHENNFILAKKIFYFYRWLQKIRLAFRNNETIKKTVTDLEFYFENIEQQYYINRGSTIQFQDAVKMFSKIQKKQTT